MQPTYQCSKCKKDKNTNESSPFLYPGTKAGEPRRFVCSECHSTKVDKIKTAARKKTHLPGGRFGI